MTIAWFCEKWQAFSWPAGHFDPPPPSLRLTLSRYLHIYFIVRKLEKVVTIIRNSPFGNYFTTLWRRIQLCYLLYHVSALHSLTWIQLKQKNTKKLINFLYCAKYIFVKWCQDECVSGPSIKKSPSPPRRSLWMVPRVRLNVLWWRWHNDYMYMHKYSTNVCFKKIWTNHSSDTVL